MILCLVTLSRGNAFINEILHAIAAEARDQGVSVEVVVDRLHSSDDDQTVYVLVPHEFFFLVDRVDWPTTSQRRRTISLCTEHPGTQWFDRAVGWGAQLGANVATNRAAMVEAVRRGVGMDHLQLGYHRPWDAWGGTTTRRPIDILYMGSEEPRRDRLLAGLGQDFSPHRTELLIPPLEPKPKPDVTFLVGADKHRRMAQSRVLVNLHRTGATALEWPRVVECICNGCVVVTESSSGVNPLVPGDHLVVTREANLGRIVSGLLADDAELDRIRRAAYAFLRDEWPMSHQVSRLLERAQRLLTHRSRLGVLQLRGPFHEPVISVAAVDAPNSGVDAARSGIPGVAEGAVETSGAEHGPGTSIADSRSSGALADSEVIEVTRSVAMGRPCQISVIMTADDDRRELSDALDAVAGTAGVTWELVVVDDGSSDGSTDLLKEWINHHPDVPAVLLQSARRRGSGWTRNRAVSASQGDLLFFLPPDHKVFPTTLSRLLQALDSDPEACLAYGIIAVHGPDGPQRLSGYLPWKPHLLRTRGNVIGTMAMVRRRALLDLQGFSEEATIQGGADLDLWRRVEAHGWHGANVTEIVARYHRSPQAMRGGGYLSRAVVVAEPTPDVVPTHVSLPAPILRHPELRSVAFFLPQFHPIPENDRWWRPGFTEWTNVVRARPRFRGHHQPHLPGELGFYDLRVPEVRELQAALASQYAIDAFCYYHYWFHGFRLLGRPVDDMLASGIPNFPFCLCWANESWTRRWDGSDEDLLVEQTYSPDDDIAHVRWLLPLFADPRYLRIGGRPLFLVYRAARLPDPRRTIETWRSVAREQGAGELYLCRVESMPADRLDPRDVGFDAAVEFQPDWINLPPRLEADPLQPGMGVASRRRPAEELDDVRVYDDMVSLAMQKPAPAYPLARGVTPGFDNSARRARDALIIRDSKPTTYERWVRWAEDAMRPGVDPPLLFVNAWNEWAEGNHIEPDARWGRAFLEAHLRGRCADGPDTRTGSAITRPS